MSAISLLANREKRDAFLLHGEAFRFAKKIVGEQMRIVSWNCNGKFREKYNRIMIYDADVYIIQECENPSVNSDEDYKKFASNSIWTGDNKNRGLGVFAKEDVCLTDNKWEDYCLRYFISCNINNEFNLIGVWAMRPYIEEYYVYQAIHKEKYDEKTVVIGDFNSNAIWDSSHGKRNHTAAVKELSEKGLVSAYHHLYKENQGEETVPTFYMYRKIVRSYHIDYCFIEPKRIHRMAIGRYEEWFDISDHMPVFIEF